MLIISVLSLSVFGCYVQAAETETSNSYDISDKQKKVYDKLYGEGNWTIDDNGLVSPTKIMKLHKLRCKIDLMNL